MTTVGFSIGGDSICIAVVQDDRPTIIVSQQGDRTTPACIAFSEEEAVVGETARQLAVKRPREVVQCITAIVAGAADADALRKRLRGSGVELVEEDGKVSGVRTYSGMDPDSEGVVRSLKELVTPLLKYMRQEAEAFIGDKIERCVIALPEEVATNADAVAIFTAAAKTAGLSVERVMRASAAAMLNNDSLTDGAHVVVDCGGTSTTTTAYTVRAGVMHVLASHTTAVGGRDIDLAVAKHFADEFKRKNKMDISDDKKAMRRLMASSENTKKMLTQRPQGRIECEAVAEGIDLNANLTRSRFDALITATLRTMKESASSCVADAGLEGKPYTLHLCGGTAHIGKVKSAMESALLEGEGEALRSSAPEEATALGAARQGLSCTKAGVGLPVESVWRGAAQGRAGNVEDAAGVRCRIRQTTQSIGVRTASGVEQIIADGALLPCSGRWQCATGGATGALIDIVQGTGDSCESLCRAALRDISAKSKGVVVTVDVQPDGRMTVTATDGLEATVEVDVPGPAGCADDS